MAIKGFDKFKRQLQDSKKKYPVVIDNIVNANAEAIALEAKSNAPVAMGDLQLSGYSAKIGDMKYKVAFSAKYAGFVEFGTGTKVNIPSEMKEVAAAIKSNNQGSFEEGLRAIKDWCKKKGIPEEAAYPILINLIQNGQRSQPFLYPAFVKGRIQLYKDLKKFVNDVSTT